jgi:hypothetical protein
MEREEIEKLLSDLRAEVHAALTKLDELAGNVRLTAKVTEIQAEKARTVALEALSEIRHIRSALTSTKPETDRAAARPRSRGRRV